MAEVIKLKVESDKQAIFVYGATGSYNANCNTGGWGFPNIEVSEIDTATVEVFMPESTTGVVIDVFPALPNEDGTGFEILAEDLGLTEITSGVWKFIYRVGSTSQNFEQQFSISKYFDEVIACCVDKMIVNADFNNIMSGSNKTKIEMEILLLSARWAACQGDLATAQTIANHINLHCKCCNGC